MPLSLSPSILNASKVSSVLKAGNRFSLERLQLMLFFQEPNSSLQQGASEEMSSVLHFYVRPSGHEDAAAGHTRRKLQGRLPELQSVKSELCYNVNWTGWTKYRILGGGTPVPRQAAQGSLPCLPAAESPPSAEEMKKLMWLFGCPLSLDDVAQESWLLPGSSDLLLEVGPRQVSPLGQLLPCSGTGFPCNILPTPSFHFHSFASSPCDPQETCFSFAPSYSLPRKPCVGPFPIWEDVLGA